MPDHTKDFDNLRVCTPSNESREHRIAFAKDWLQQTLELAKIDREVSDYYFDTNRPHECRMRFIGELS